MWGNGSCNRKRTDSLLVRQLKAWAQDATILLGDWSRPNQRFHKPSPGVGIVRMPRKAGLDVTLVDEYLTSKDYPACEQGTLEPFRRVRNPRPYRSGRVVCHGLLRCTNDQCKVGERHRLWNRDVAAALNIRAIVNGLPEHGRRPERFARPTGLA